MTTKMIMWTPARLRQFKKHYAQWIDKPRAVFKFDGNEYVVGYAKYLI